MSQYSSDKKEFYQVVNSKGTVISLGILVPGEVISTNEQVNFIDEQLYNLLKPKMTDTPYVVKPVESQY